MSCGKEISPTAGSVSRGSGCRFCSEIGIDYTAPGYVYLITNPTFQAHKVGIANTHPRKAYYDRLSQHESRGWVTVAKHELDTAEKAFIIEQQFLGWVRGELGLGIYLSKAEMPQGGFSETFSGHDPITTFSEKLNYLVRAAEV
jgi:hypothetical protein